LFDRADRAGIVLPEKWATTRDSADALAIGYAKARARSQAHRAGFAQRAAIDDLLKAVQAGASIPEPDELAAPVLEVEREDRVADIATSMLVSARDSAERVLESQVRHGAEGLIGQLSTALAEVVAAAKQLAPQVDGIDPADPRAVLRAPELVQAALKTLDGESSRYRAIRACQLAVMSLAKRSIGTYSLLREPRYRPADEDMLTALLADIECSPWVPTAGEEAAFQREKEEESRANAPKPRIPSMSLTGVG
jgi:hypothetical protein